MKIAAAVFKSRAMTRVAHALVFLVACGGGSPPPPPAIAVAPVRNRESQPAAIESVDDPQVFCDRAVAAIERWRACDPSARAESDGSYESFGQWEHRDQLVKLPAAERSWVASKVGMHCAQFIVRLSTHRDNERCKGVDATGSRAASQYLDEFYRDRIAISPTGHPTSDASLQQLATLRERACACKDQPCAETIEREVAPETMLPANAPSSARDLARLLLSEIHWRCVDGGRFARRE